MRGLEGRIALVTGAGRGVGRAIAERFAAEGATVAVTDVDKDTAAAVATSLGERALPVHLDVTSRQSVGAAVEEITTAIGPIDILVNNAGWDRMAPFLDTDEDLWERLIAINLKGPIHTTRAVLPGMVDRKAGRVVNLASDAGRVGSSGEAVYSAAKGGVIAFTKTLAREMARHGITVNCVCPGPTDTPLLRELMSQGNEGLVAALERAIPLGRIARPEEVAAAVVFLASDDASFITGQTLSASGGLTMA